ncbi:hypothetical protein [Paenibacillus segetis]|uniref:Uncharacterized protein n=1 Tax=Paenibacillus segetis TaxID=1325360 RepID=A0ABQ1Y358_9BACL|nr:hypothetical protein [Paenibacillus segetis]GGH10091.1 hypothetical protein GCM10008013_01370 [Paenibacillus segetis]
MKVKFVKVWDDTRFGYVKHIVLQVEESDTFLTDANFNPGYKIIISAVYHHVGAAGGHNFNPYHGNRVTDLSSKIDFTESDVLGFYLNKVKDIHEMPEELYTDSFWNVVRTDSYGEIHRVFDDDWNSYYKVLHTNKFSFEELRAKLSSINTKSNLFEESGIDIESFFDKQQEWMNRLDKTSGRTNNKKNINYAIIDKQSLEICSDTWSTSSQRTIADYLWCPCDELPEFLWEQVQNKNEMSLNRIFRLNEDI